MKTISLLHPFSAEAIGLEQKDLYYSHSKPHQLALEQFQEETDNKVSISYFTPNRIPYKKELSKIEKYFWPVTSPWGKRASHWRAQHSLWHYYAKPADVTIINMSGHGSKYTFTYAKKLKQKNLGYIAMIGGMNMTFTGKALTYYQEAHHLITHTQLQKNALLEIPAFTHLDIRVLPLGINTEKFKPQKTKTKTKAKDNKVSLLFVGRITPLKRIELSLEIVAELKNRGIPCSLQIIGFLSDDNYYESLNQKVKELQISAEVNFLGALEQDKLIPFYQEAELLLLPSKHESFGMVLVEAMACGTAAASTIGSGGPEEIIQHKKNGLLLDELQYVEKTADLCANKIELTAMKEEARRQVLKRFSSEKTYQVLKKSINDALSE